jgi:hypothetical protein
LSHCVPSQGISAVMLMLVSVLVSVFVGPGWGTRWEGGIECVAGVDVVSGFVHVVVAFSRCYVVFFRFRRWLKL